MSKKGGLGKFLLGAGIGAGIALLLAPKSGEETRKELKAKMDELVKKAKEIDKDEVVDAINSKIADIKSELSDLDKERVLSIAESKAEALKEKSAELVEIAKEKGTPVLVNAAESVCKSVIKVSKSALKKLEEAK